MKSLNEIKETNGIKVIEEGFQQTVRAGVGCSCTVDVNMKDFDWEPDNWQTIVAAHYIEVSHP